MTVITIIEEASFGYKNQDKSIHIPDTGELEKKIEGSMIFAVKPDVVEFLEHHGYNSNSPCDTYAAVRTDSTYFVWIAP